MNIHLIPCRLIAEILEQYARYFNELSDRELQTSTEIVTHIGELFSTLHKETGDIVRDFYGRMNEND
jgi:hypothetical protein